MAGIFSNSYSAETRSSPKRKGRKHQSRQTIKKVLTRTPALNILYGSVMVLILGSMRQQGKKEAIDENSAGFRRNIQYPLDASFQNIRYEIAEKESV